LYWEMGLSIDASSLLSRDVFLIRT